MDYPLKVAIKIHLHVNNFDRNNDFILSLIWYPLTNVILLHITVWYTAGCSNMETWRLSGWLPKQTVHHSVLTAFNSTLKMWCEHFHVQIYELFCTKPGHGFHMFHKLFIKSSHIIPKCHLFHSFYSTDHPHHSMWQLLQNNLCSFQCHYTNLFIVLISKLSVS
jgi:hypothetical protein